MHTDSSGPTSPLTGSSDRRPGPMLARQRQEHILARVTAAGGVRVADVVSELGISEMTVRRDITALVAQGLVERVHGGAVAPRVPARHHAVPAPGSGTAPCAAPEPASGATQDLKEPGAGTGPGDQGHLACHPPDRLPDTGPQAPGAGDSAAAEAVTQTGQGARTRIGVAAASLVRPGDRVALSGGSTALAVARALTRSAHLPTLTVVTNSLPAAQLLFDAADALRAASRDHPTVLLTGGGRRAPSGALVGPAAVDALRTVHVEWAFLGSCGFSPESGLTSPDLDEAAANQALAATGRTVVALVDGPAWGTVGLKSFCPTQDIDVLVTDTQPEDRVVRALRDTGTSLVVAHGSPHATSSTVLAASPGTLPATVQPHSPAAQPAPTPGDQR